MRSIQVHGERRSRSIGNGGAVTDSSGQGLQIILSRWPPMCATFDSPKAHRVRPLDVLFLDNHLLAVNKPAGLVTQGAGDDAESLLVAAKLFLKRKFDKPGKVYLGVVSRLDRTVSGVVLFARTSKAAARLSEQFASRNVEKRYWALVEGHPRAEEECRDLLWHDDAHHRVMVVHHPRSGAKEAVLRYQTRERHDDRAWLEIELLTGRKHQIRVQLAQRGLSVLGDRRYGSRVGFAEGIALHGRELRLEHPVSRQPLTLVADLPKSWATFGASVQPFLAPIK